jgi:hypothetical protein
MAVFTLTAPNGEKHTVEARSRAEAIKTITRRISKESQGPTVEAAAAIPMTKNQEAFKEGRARSIAPDDPRRANNLGQSGYAGGIMNKVNEGASMGYGQEIQAAAYAALGATPEGDWFDYERPFGERYNVALGAETGRDEKFTEQNPKAALAAEFAGMLPTIMGASRAGLTLMGRGLGVGGAAAEGAVYGGIYGSGTAEPGERLEGGAVGAAYGAGTGAVIQKTAGAMASAFARKQAIKAAPTAAELRSQSREAYRQVEEAGVTFRKDTGAQAAEKMTMDMRARGLDPIGRNQPQAEGVRRSTVEALESGASMEDLAARRMGAQMAKGAPQESNLSDIVVRAIDDFVADPRNIASNVSDQVKVGKLLASARDLWGRGAKSDAILDILEEAADATSRSGTGGNFENNVRRKVEQLYTQKRSKGFYSKAEVKMMRKFVRIGGLDRLLRGLGRMDPTTNALTALLQGGGVLGGAAMGGGAVGLAVPAAGFVAKRLSDKSTRQGAEELAATFRSGGTMQGGQAVPPRYQPTPSKQALLRALSGQAGAQ